MVKFSLKSLRATTIPVWSLMLTVALLLFFATEFFLVKGEYQTLSSKHAELASELDMAKGENERLNQEVRDQQYTIESFQDQIGSIGRVVGDLQKLKDTDEELLKKYSKVAFLNENYTPSRLREIDKEYLFNKEAKFLIHSDVWPYLEELLTEARRQGIELLIASAFRSFGTQAALKSGYVITYGAGTANQFSAEQGFSEHQLGTALDFTTPAVGAFFAKFEADPAYQWLRNNAHRYGFAPSYPKGNTYYKFEPWHWRFIGVELATRLHDEGKYFYDLDQREIDTYLIKIFD